MPAAKRAAAPRGSGRSRTPKAVSLPPITVGKFEDAGRLLERVVSENRAVFIAKGQAFKEQHRQGSSRPLTALEAAQVAVAASEGDPVVKAAEIQQGDLRAYDEPDVREVLLAAGLGTAPAVVEAFRSVVALIEMPSEEYEAAYEDDRLGEQIDERAKTLRTLELSEARKRTAAAMEHFARSAGFDPGEAWSLPVKAIWQALSTAASQLTDAPASSQLIDSAASTAGTADTSVTG